MDTLFFYVSKIIWLLVSPDSLLLILLIFSVTLLFLGKISSAKILLSAVSFTFILIAFFPLGEWLLNPLESHFITNPTLPAKLDGIIVLSGSEEPELSHIWNQVEVGATAERNLAFLNLARRYPKAKLIFTGGTGRLTNQRYKAADVAKTLFEQQNFNINKIKFESKSRNTFENATYSKKVAKPLKNENWVLITTSWHMPRSIGIFCKINWPTIPYPVDHQTRKGNLYRVNFDLAKNLSILKIGIKEWLGLFAYYLSGKTTSLLPKKC